MMPARRRASTARRVTRARAARMSAWRELGALASSVRHRDERGDDEAMTRR